MSAPQDPQQPSTLDRLYGAAGHVSAIEQDLATQREQLLAQIEARQQGLQQQRQAADAAGDSASVQQIDSELDQLDEAYQTLTQDQDSDADPAHAEQDEHGGSQHGRHADVPGGG
jgi:DNA repair exonuclease SbcCD ATPase subunit